MTFTIDGKVVEVQRLAIVPEPGKVRIFSKDGGMTVVDITPALQTAIDAFVVSVQAALA
jgi:hypothetical protein